MGAHERTDTFDAVVSDYVTGKARQLLDEFDQFDAQPIELRTAFPMDKDAWIGQAAEILRELTRNA